MGKADRYISLGRIVRQTERFGLLFKMQKIACVTSCLWGNYILKARKVLNNLKVVCLAPLYLRRGILKWSSSHCVLGDPQAVVCRSLVLVTLYPIPTSTELKVMFSTSVYHYSRVSGEDSSIRLEITQKVKEGWVCSEWTPTANPLPRTQRK